MANADKDFKAEVNVGTSAPWELTSESPFQLGVGGSGGWGVKNTENEEETKSGAIILFKVDVEIAGVGEDKEDTEGAFVGCFDCGGDCSSAASAMAMKPVKITCTPPGYPGASSEDKIIISSSGGGRLFVKNGANYTPAQSSYKVNEINSMSFWLHGHAASGSQGDQYITAKHSVNGCEDSAKSTVIKASFVVESDDPHHSGTTLTDNRQATVTISVAGISNPETLVFQLEAEPVETGSLINKGGTSIGFTPTDDPLVWRTSTVYWYGLLPDNCCWNNKYAYLFSLSVLGCVVTEQYHVDWPNESPRMVGDVSATSSTIIHESEPVPGIANFYRCLIEFGGFLKTARVEEVPTTDQYNEETTKEEEFHAKQWLGEVSTSEGGQGDCFTAKGVAWHANCVGAGPWHMYGFSPEVAKAKAEDTVEAGEREEKRKSLEIWESDRGFVELKAKAHAGYNAAWKSHCTYEQTYGATPKNHNHPAY